MSLDIVDNVKDINNLPDPPVPGIFRVVPPSNTFPYDYGVVLIITAYNRNEAVALYMTTGDNHSLYFTTYDGHYTGSSDTCTWGPWQTVCKPS